jgi:hypothetical protein
MEFSPKLKNAAEEIKAILEKHDIAGHVVLHTPGHGEYFTKLDPSYSCAFFDMTPGKEGIRFRARLQEDYKGDSAKRQKAVTDTSNMMNILCTTGGNMLMNLMDAAKMLDKIVDAKHGKGGHSSQTQQNN